MAPATPVCRCQRNIPLTVPVFERSFSRPDPAKRSSGSHEIPAAHQVPTSEVLNGFFATHFQLRPITRPAAIVQPTRALVSPSHKSRTASAPVQSKTGSILTKPATTMSECIRARHINALIIGSFRRRNAASERTMGSSDHNASTLPRHSHCRRKAPSLNKPCHRSRERWGFEVGPALVTQRVDHNPMK